MSGVIIKRNIAYNISFSTLANIDLEAIISYYHELNESTAKRYYLGIITLIRKLLIFPLMGRAVPECQDVFYDKYRELIYENYRIVFRIDSENFYIPRIIDARMETDYSFIE